MRTVLELLNLSSEYLEKKGIESPRLNAELLLAGVMNCKRLQLYLSFDKPLDEAEVNKYRDFIKRRGQFEPLQYILGEIEFYGLAFKVNTSVLIPRQETEILVETIIKIFAGKGKITGVDIGTGSGIIPVVLAKNLNCEKLIALDISGEAIKTARQNAELHKVENIIDFVQADIKSGGFSAESGFDLVVSNPPYVSVDEYKNLQAEITGFEPKEAVTDFGDGFSFYKTISKKGIQMLKPGGLLAFEAGQGQAEIIAEIMNEAGYKNIIFYDDYLGIKRVITGEKS